MSGTVAVKEFVKMVNEIVALIGVRGGSKRVTHKNHRQFAGTNLLKLKIEALQQVKGISRVIVNSECRELLALAAAYGAETVVRDPEFATDSVLTSDYYRHIAEHCDAEVILSPTVTTPLVQLESYERGIRTFHEMEGSEYDSITSSRPIKEFLYLDGKPLNYDPARQVRSQDLPNIVALNYGYSIIRRELMIEYKNVVGKRPYFVHLSQIESVDIDTLEDFGIAETLYKAGHAQTDSLRKTA